MGMTELRRSILLNTPHLETASGDIATFQTDMIAPLKSATVTLTPQQDLHGYDYPWVAGGNKNLIPDGTATSKGFLSSYLLKSDGTTETSNYYNITEYFQITAGETYTWSCLSATIDLSSVCFYDENKDFISGIAAEQSLPKTITAPSNAVYCRTVQGKDFSTRGCQLELGSTATEILPYSNIGTISGYTSIKVTATGENLIKPSSNNIKNVNGSYSLDSSSGIITSSSSTCQTGVCVPVKAGVPYSWSFKRMSGGTTYTRVALYKAWPTSWDARARTIVSSKLTSNSKSSGTFTPSAGENYIYLSTYKSSSAAVFTVGEFTLRDDGSNIYVEPQVTELPISWQAEHGIIYGCIIDIASGLLTVTYSGIVYTSSNINLLTYGSGYLFAKIGYNGLTTWQNANYCSHYKLEGSPVGIIGGNSGNAFWIRAQDLSNPPVRASVTSSNIQDYRDYFVSEAEAGRPLTIVWKNKVSTPIYQLSLNKIKSLVGENNVWNDASGIEVKYWKH